ncbi:MAG: Gfo/Idh/MocA family oxidoreductase, partial [Planctomycetota bacterium]|nr:Gfo/Idh/MocA family oxidoreductase [Planctomycetota bacterium]
MIDLHNRREFLSNATVATFAAGVSLSGTRSYADTSPNNRVIVGVMGLSRGQYLASGFARQQNVEVKYVCDVDSTRIGPIAKKLESDTGKAPQQVGDFRRILDDQVCAAPNHWHAPATILACAAGKHVYVEKPCSHNPREGELMVEAARKYNRAVQMGCQRRSAEGWIEAVQRLHQGVIGRVYLARSWFAKPRGSIGIGVPGAVPPHIDYELWQGPAPRRPYLSNVLHYNWNWLWHWGNGELGNNGVHRLDLCRWAMDVDFPIRVTSSGGRYDWKDDQETPDTHAVCFEFPENRQITW